MTDRSASSDSTGSQRVQGARVLLVEDELLFARAVKLALSRGGYRCEHAATLSEARALMASFAPVLVLLDMRLPDGSGLDFLSELKSDPSAEVSVVVLTAYGEVDDAVTAMKAGAADYLKKPIDLDELLVNVEKVARIGSLSRQLDYSRVRDQRHNEIESMVGDSPALSQVRAQVGRISGLVAPGGSAPTVLITGETGTGKDVTARAIHQHSSRSHRPFVQVDCAALPKDLFEAELFGHVKGAFTHAVNARTGLIEAAEDGVVFLDEIGEIPLDLQAKLLAVLERRTLRRIGSAQETRTDAWFIAATNRDVGQMVADGALRADLFFRLNVLTLSLPPLRERTGDAVLLAERFAGQLARRYQLSDVSFSSDARHAIDAYSWPGNVRELQHVVERALLFAAGGEVDASALGLPSSAISGIEPEVESGLPATTEGLTLDGMERRMISLALQETGGNVSEAARRLGISRMAMRYRMEKYGVK